MDNVYSAAEIISSLFENISPEQIQNTNTTLSVWKKILFSMDEHKERRDGQKSYTGQNLYYHSKIVDLKNGVLLVEVDHPGWIQLFQMAQKYIIKGLKKSAPELKISVLSFRLKGQKAELSALNRAATQKQEKEAAVEEQATETAAGEQRASNSELPEQLKLIFDRLRENVLTQERKL
jgi:hypothetical protein